MRTLTGEGVPNITQPTAEYPFGKYKDKTSPSTNDGTELSERTLGDCYQGMLNTITGAGMTPNNEPERKGDSQFQKAVELLKPVATCVVGTSDETTFTVLSSIIRDQEITLGTGYIANTSNTDFLVANFHIKRNGSVDTSRRYIVTASPAYKIDVSDPVTTSKIPKIIVAHSPYFNNINISIGGLSNLLFLFSENVSPSDALSYARAVLTIYDAGPVS